MKRPALWLIPYFISTIMYGRIGARVYALCIIILMMVGIIIMDNRFSKKSFIAIAICALLGVFAGNAARLIEGSGSKSLEKAVYAGDTSFTAVVEDIRLNASGRQSLRLKSGDASIYALLAPGEQSRLGSIVEVEGRLEGFEDIEKPSGFNEKDYMLSQGYDYKIYPESMRELAPRASGLGVDLSILRERVSMLFAEILPADESGIVSAMALGIRDGMDESLNQLYVKAGVSHILAVSGMHLSILCGGVFGILCSAFKADRRKAAAAAMAIALSYAFITGSSASAMRAACISFIYFGGILLFRRADGFNSLAIAAVVCLAARPSLIFNAGFQLSFTAHAGVISAANLISKMKKRPNAFFSAFIISAAAYISTLPIVLWHFSYIPVYSILMNMLVVPFMPVIMVSALLSALAAVISAEASAFIIGAAYVLLRICTAAAEFSTSLPYAYMCLGRPDISAVIMFYICAAVIYNLGSIKLCNRLTLLVSVILLGASLNINRLLNIHSVAFLDVGQGDSAVITSDDGFCAVIDTGGLGYLEADNNTGSRVVIPYLERMGITRIDALILSHFDSDHTLGAAELLESVEVGAVAVPDYDFPPSGSADAVVEAVEKSGTPVYKLGAGDSFSAGDIVFNCIYPDEAASDRFDDDNSGSLVINAEIDGVSVLFTGDMGAEQEAAVLEAGLAAAVDTDILKVAHHGSAYSSTGEFISAASPEYAVISCGKNNIYGHPAPDTVKRLEDGGADIYSTAERGSIIFKIINGRAYLW